MFILMKKMDIYIGYVHFLLFEAIHPFPDGNGHTSRILNLLYLVNKGRAWVPFSNSKV
ncbi:Fic family protein [Sphingobacterium mizutaii]|uniref:Fic family protein n=1 Tax=Sphingobacterium mizutaii TaxID=1010 RepID=UPI0035E42941